MISEISVEHEYGRDFNLANESALDLNIDSVFAYADSGAA